MSYYKDGVLQEGSAPEVPLPEAPKHSLDDGRELEGMDGWARVTYFDYLENIHIYERKYPAIEEQLDMLYWNKVNGTENWKAAIDKIKADTPKAE